MDRCAVAAAIFDMDGTILDSSGIWENAQLQIIQELGYTPAPTLIDDLFPLSGEESVSFLIREYHMKESARELTNLIDQRISAFYCRQVRLKPGAWALLRRLHCHDIPLALVTANERRYVEPALTLTGVLDLFDAVIPTAEGGFSKFDPQVFLETSRQLGADPNATWVFEDALHAIRTASGAGFRTCAVEDPLTRKDWDALRRTADCYLQSFLDWEKLPFSRQLLL